MECFVRSGNDNASIVDNPAYKDCFLYTACGKYIATSKLCLAMRSKFFHQVFILNHNQGNVNIFMFEFPYEIVKLALDVILGADVNVPVKQRGRLKFMLNKLKVKFDIKTVTESAQPTIEKAISEQNHEQQIVDSSDPPIGMQVNDSLEEQISPVSSKPGLTSSQSTMDGKEEHLKHDEGKQTKCDKGELSKQYQHASKKTMETDSDCLNRTNCSESSLLNWTNTTSAIDLDRIDHTTIVGQIAEKYMCLKCKATCNYFRLAEKHFHREHKEFTAFRTLLMDADFERKILETRYEEIKKYISINKSTADGKMSLELRQMHQKICEIMEKFDKVSRSEIEGAPTLIRKKHSMLKMLDELGEKVDQLLDIL